MKDPETSGLPHGTAVTHSDPPATVGGWGGTSPAAAVQESFPGTLVRGRVFRVSVHAITIDSGGDGSEASSMPADHMLTVYRGDSHAWQFRFWADSDRTTAYDLTGAELAAQVRRQHDARNPVTLDCAVELPNVVRVYLSADRARRVPGGVWDMRATWPDGRVVTLVAGKVVVTLDVTHDD